MKKLIFNDSRQIEVQSVTESNGILHVRLILTSAEALKALFQDTFATKKLTYFENQQQIAVYENYTMFKYVKEEIGGIWEVEIAQKERDMGTRLGIVENEIEKIKGGGAGVDTELFNATVFVARTSAQLLPDAEAIKVKAIYETWDELVKKNFVATDASYKFTNKDVLYKTINPGQEFQVQWVPGEGTESIFTRIDETHSGTKEDPIPYFVNMEVFQGKYYTEDGILYKCTRDSGQALHNKASELVGHYFEVVG